MFGKNKSKANIKEVKLEAPKPRPKEEIQFEYTNVCTKAGHIQYQIDTLQRDLNLLNETLRNLNSEALKIQQEEESKKAAPESVEQPKSKEEGK